MAQATVFTLPGLLKFYSKEEIKKYLRDLAGFYQGQVDTFGEQLGTLMRSGQEKAAEDKKQKKQDDEKSKFVTKGWTKMGTLLVSLGGSVSAITEVSLQLHEEYKAKLAKTSEALKSFEEQANTLIPENSTYRLYLKNGVPERILVEAAEAKRDTFGYTAQFQLV